MNKTGILRIHHGLTHGVCRLCPGVDSQVFLPLEGIFTGSIYKRKYKDNHGNIVEGTVYWIKCYQKRKPYRGSTESIKEADAKKVAQEKGRRDFGW